ncbi:MAG TPA: hypothetical protein VM054_01590 [bacterium]|nr:hypothetical protein [bacterium]
MKRATIILALLTAVVSPAAESVEYTAATAGAGLIYSLDPENPDRWYVDFAGAESDWRITVYRTPEHLFLSLPIRVEGEGIPAGMQRWALERNFDLPLVKFALDPTGTRLHLAADLRTSDTSPEAYLEVLGSLAATAEREHALLRAYATP